jgi:transposase InsO family protein
MKFEFIDKHRSCFAVERMCRNLSVSRSAYYAWRNRPLSRRAQANETLKTHVKAAFRQFRGVYGSPRIARELRAQGMACSENRIARIMHREGLRAYTKRKFKVTTNSKHDLPVAPNLVNQNFEASGPNRLWASDISYIWTREGWLYLAVILDVFSRQIVGWTVSNRMTKELVLSAVRKAIAQRKPAPGLIFHSDRGSQYASHEVRKLLKDHKMLPSMSKKGDCYDNAIVETFFKTLKTELVYLIEPFKTRNEAKHSLFYYIESFYNRIRRHSAIGYLAPAKFEKLKNAA